MKERILVVIACVLSCVIIFGSIIAYKEHRRANADVEMSQSTTDEKTEENTFAKEEITTQANKETEDNSSETTTKNKPNKAPVSSTKTTTKKNTTTTTEAPTTEKVYPVLAESKADMIRVINSVTASASKGSYNLTRICYTEKEFDTDNTAVLNGIIQKVNPKATFNSAFNEHMDVGTTKATIRNGKATNDIREEYLLKAMSITEDDIRNWRQRDNKIIVNLVEGYPPTTYEHLTNDYITPNTFVEFFSKYTTEYPIEGVTLYYGLATLEATIDDGKLTKLKITHIVYADLVISYYNELRGVYVTETTYSDIFYK